jgi:hypothetical protein
VTVEVREIGVAKKSAVHRQVRAHCDRRVFTGMRVDGRVCLQVLKGLLDGDLLGIFKNWLETSPPLDAERPEPSNGAAAAAAATSVVLLLSLLEKLPVTVEHLQVRAASCDSSGCRTTRAPVRSPLDVRIPCCFTINLVIPVGPHAPLCAWD